MLWAREWAKNERERKKEGESDTKSECFYLAFADKAFVPLHLSIVSASWWRNCGRQMNSPLLEDDSNSGIMPLSHTPLPVLSDVLVFCLKRDYILPLTRNDDGRDHSKGFGKSIFFLTLVWLVEFCYAFSGVIATQLRLGVRSLNVRICDIFHFVSPAMDL